MSNEVMFLIVSTIFQVRKEISFKISTYPLKIIIESEFANENLINITQ